MASKKRDLPRNVYKNGDKYNVAQQVNGKRIYYATCLDREEAIQLRNKLVKEGVITDRTGKHRLRGRMRYITKYGNKYCIYKNVDGKQECFGTFHSLEEAIDERDYLESIGWDYGDMY